MTELDVDFNDLIPKLHNIDTSLDSYNVVTCANSNPSGTAIRICYHCPAIHLRFNNNLIIIAIYLDIVAMQLIHKCYYTDG